MSKFLKIVRNNWKKSVVGTVTVLYGIDYGYDKYKIAQLMRTYCEEAVLYGDVPVPPTLKPKNITVILNPAANRRKAKSNFEKYCAPILNLAGYTVTVLQTESEGQARKLVAELADTDIVVVAGGDGTLSETVTGLMRAQGGVRWPVGVLPLGRTNSVACALLGREREGAVSPAEMAAAAMAVVRGQTKHVDALRVDVIQQEEELETPKPVYGLSGLKWGVYRDALSRQDSYWYLGVLRAYAAVLFTSLGSHEPVVAHVVFTHACDGCNRCYQNRQDLLQPQQRWYHYLLPTFTRRTAEVTTKDYSQVKNDQCGIVSEVDLTSVDFNVACPCVCQGSKGIRVSLGPDKTEWSEYVTEGWRRAKGEPPNTISQLEAQQMEIIPKAITNKESDEKWFAIDNEEYEVRPIRITLIPKLLQVFNPKQSQTSYTLLERALLGCC